MAYWDYLQTGNTKNIFRLRTSALQKKMDGKEPGHSQTRMQEQYLWWKQQHGYAA